MLEEFDIRIKLLLVLLINMSLNLFNKNLIT
jgi:hypothetical protein